MNEFPRIERLSENLSNQIAAGEVVERPAAALKELIENSLDAGARSLRIAIQAGGSALLEVADDGYGIHPDDLLLSLDRHATSKIRTTEDLFALRSWGFRGEALASIAAVSRLTIRSRRQGLELGREIVSEGGTILSDSPNPRPQGTSVRMENLFFNTPARRKFLKSQGSETSQCLGVIHRLALASPEIAFEVTNDGEPAFRYPAAKSQPERLVQVFRAAWNLDVEEKDLLAVDESSGPMRLQGWLLPSKFFIPSSRGIFTYVNRRTVKDKLLQQAILTAAKEVLFGSLYPQLALFLEMPAEWVDVNVHPTKAEVRFREGGAVFGLIRKTIEKALGGDRRGSVSLASDAFPPEASLPFFSASPTHFHQKQGPEAQPFAAYAPASPAQPLPAAAKGPQFLGTLRNTYLVCQDDDGLLLVDQHAAHERVTYERLKNSLGARASSPLLIPIQVELPHASLDRMEGEFPRLAELGLGIDRTGPNIASVRELPNLLLRRDGSPALSIGNLLRDMAGSWEETAQEGEFAEKVRDRILHSLATESCHGSVRAGQSLSPAEAQALLAQMSETDFSGHCPHGRPTTVRFRWSEIERLFKRVF